jgi:aspartate kinase
MVSSGENEEFAIKDARLQGAYDDLSELGAVDIVSDMAIVSLVGKDLKNLTGISGKFFSVLGENNINVSLRCKMLRRYRAERSVSIPCQLRDAVKGISYKVCSRDALPYQRLSLRYSSPRSRTRELTLYVRL